MSVTTVTKTWAEWRLWGEGYGWSTRYTASATITVTRNTGSDTATVKIDATMTTPSGDNSLGAWQCVATINGANSGGGEKTFDLNTAGYHAVNSSYTVSQTYTVGVGVSAGTLSGTIKMRIGGYPGYQGEYSESQAWSLTYDTKGTPSQATWSNYYFGNSSTITIQRVVPDFRESVYLVWSDNTTVTIRTYSQSSATTISYTIPYNTCPTNAQSRSAKIRVVTYNGSTQIGTWETSPYSVTIKSGDNTYKPTLSANPTCQAYNDVVAQLGTDTAVAQYSKLNVKAKKADVSLKYSATISSRVVTFSNGSSASADQEDHISSLLTSAGTITWTYTVTDSRGFTVTKTGTFTVINSSAPSITGVTVFRGDSGGTQQEGGAYLYATATANCESLNGHNSVTLKGKVDSGAYQDMTNGVRKTLKSDADANTQYVITLTATDLLRPTSIQIILPAAIIPFHVTLAKDGFGIATKGTSGNLNIGTDANIILGKKIKYDGKGDLVRLAETKAQVWATAIAANSNLNSPTLCEVGQYYCGADATASTYTNCPTGGLAFMMNVFAPIQETYDVRTGYTEYRVREILTYTGKRFVQEVSKSSTEVWTYGAWNMVNTSLVSEGGNVAQWLKAMVGRQSSIDFTHIYDGDRVHARLDIVTSSLSPNPFGADGYVLTFMWDNSGAYDTQLFIPNNTTKGLQYRLKGNSSWGNAIPIENASVDTGSISMVGGAQGSLNETKVVQRGGFVNVRGYVSGVASGQEIGNLFKFSGVDMPKTYIRATGGSGSQAYYAYNSCYIGIATDGTCAVRKTSAGSADSVITFNITYSVD